MQQMADVPSHRAEQEAMQAGGSVECVAVHGIATVTLSHPGKFNAMSRSMWRRLRDVFAQLQADSTIRCVAVQGADGHFCAGGDISEYPGFRFDEEALAHFHENEVWGALQAMLDCDVPVVALISGNCMGAGVEIASCCDLRLAADSSRFGAPIARLGFPMAPKEAALVAKAVGDATARAMLLAAQTFDATHMYSQGFLTQVETAERLQVAGRELMERVATLAPLAARMNKQTLRGTGQVNPFAFANSAEHREGIAAFLEKRKPAF